MLPMFIHEQSDLRAYSRHDVPFPGEHMRPSLRYRIEHRRALARLEAADAVADAAAPRRTLADRLRFAFGRQ